MEERFSTKEIFEAVWAAFSEGFYKGIIAHKFGYEPENAEQMAREFQRARSAFLESFGLDIEDQLELLAEMTGLDFSPCAHCERPFAACPALEKEVRR
jgi:hypothetical protein